MKKFSDLTLTVVLMFVDSIKYLNWSLAIRKSITTWFLPAKVTTCSQSCSSIRNNYFESKIELIVSTRIYDSMFLLFPSRNWLTVIQFRNEIRFIDSDNLEIKSSFECHRKIIKTFYLSYLSRLRVCLCRENKAENNSFDGNEWIVWERTISWI